MLDRLRGFARTPIAKVLIVLLVVASVAWGVSGYAFSIGSNTIMRVGSEEITANDFQRAYQRVLNLVAQQTGQVPTPETAMAMQLPAQVIVQLSNDAAVDSLGKQLGLGVSEDRLGKMLRENPSFASPLGGFDPNAFLNVLRQNGYTETDFIAEQTDLARRDQIEAALVGDAAAPQVALELFHRFLNDTRSIEYFTLTTLNVELPPDPTEADLEAMLAADPAPYRLAERRTVQVMTLTPEQIAQGIEITDEQVAAEYERTKASLIRPERRLIWQVSLPDEAAATIFLNAKASGRSFDEAVEEARLPVAEIGMLSQAEIVDASLAAEAFALAEGDFKVVPGASGQRVIHIADIDPGGETTLDQASETIRQQLALAEARSQYVDILDQIEELRAAFRPLPEIAERYGLDLDEVVVTGAGQELGAIAAIPETDRARVAQTIFSAEEGRLAPTVALAATRNVWFDLEAVEPARDQTLDEARSALEAAWFVQKSNENLKAETDRLVGLLKQGYPLNDVAFSVGQVAGTSDTVTRNGDGSPVIDVAVGNAIFGGGVGHVGSALNGDGGQVIFKVTGVTPATDDADAQIEAQVAATIRDGAYRAWVSGVRDTVGTSNINQAALDQTLALTAPSAP